MDEARARIVDLVARIIDPEAFMLLAPWDKPIEERSRIRERQVVAMVRANQVLDRLVQEFPQALAILLRDERHET